MKKAVFTCSICVLLCVCACAKKNTESTAGEYSRILNSASVYNDITHRWFYFTDEGFKEIDVPRNAPKTKKKPWTQAVRICSSALIADTGYFLVNKLGMLVCPSASGVQKEGIGSKTKLVKDSDIFLSAAAGLLFCIEGKPVFNLYKNSLFPSEKVNQKKADVFLVQYVAENQDFIPLLSRGDFDWPSEAEVRELFFSENNWYVLLKAAQSERTEFYAYSFYTIEPVTAFASAFVSASSGSSGFKPEIIEKNISVQEFRERSKPRCTFEMPENLKDLLVPISAKIPWYLEHVFDGGQAAARFVCGEDTSNSRQAYSVSNEKFAAAVFEDGTVCFAGVLPMKHVVNAGKPIAFKLPPLPAGYTYSSVLIAGSTLFAAWEETSFFETGRSGFLAVDLEQILYL